MLAWVIEGLDARGAWWVGRRSRRAKCLETAMRFTDQRMAEIIAFRLKAKALEVLY